ncbi:MAG TPA: alpha/beta fold hydrolase [Saprospiraceae bacterium]|nr:alpha/beta fold hydrolase [Saprospiraceae bacterium]
MKQTFFFLLVLLLGACDNDLMDPLTPGALVPRTVAEDPTLPSLLINGNLLHVESFGNPSDPILVLLHGGPGGDYRSLLNAKDFAQQGYFVVFYDQRGTGLSERLDRSHFPDVQVMIDDLHAVIDHFQTSNEQKVFLMGHSWGAMLATAYINQHPTEIDGVVLAEPGGFTWPQAKDYVSRANAIDLTSEALNDALFPEQIFAGRDEHEILDYKAAYFQTFENAPGNTIGNAGPYPFWRSGAVSADAMFDFAEEHGFDFTTHLQQYDIEVLFAYSEFNTAYGPDWAHTVGDVFPHVTYFEVNGSGHELLYFGWNAFYPVALTYLNKLK